MQNDILSFIALKLGRNAEFFIIKKGGVIMKKKLTIRQKRFADEYIISGNATQSAVNAGYSKKTAYSIACNNMKKPEILEYIKKRMEEVDAARTMQVKEAIEVSSSIARGEVQKGYKKVFNKLTKKIEEELEYEFTPRVEERQKSLEHILRCNGAFTDKVELNANAYVEIIDDIEAIDDKKAK